jgi:hypothetical protein
VQQALLPGVFKIRATLNRIDRRGKLSHGPCNVLDKHRQGLSRVRKLSTFFVDNCVHHLYKGAVSWFFQSVFCFAIKKWTLWFFSINQHVEIKARAVTRVSGRSPYDFVTIVDEEDGIDANCQEGVGASIRTNDALYCVTASGLVL